MAGEPPTTAGGPELEFGPYTVMRRADGSPWKLGAGGMGVTYKATDEMLHRPVAIKVIAPGRWHEPRTRALFLREARAAARVRHENVASVVYLGDEPNNFFMAIEFVDGVCLDDRLRAQGPLAPLLAVELSMQIARGLAAIHEQQIVHRDLKPSNLMLVPTRSSRSPALDDSSGWQVKIIDFGLARSFTASGLGTQAGALTSGFVGTAVYASPEQCAEQSRIDGRSDLYALGCILWEMLAGRPPFFASTQRAMLNQHIGRPPPMARMLWLPPSLVRILERLLAKDPGDRYSSATETVRALKNCRDLLLSGAEQVDESRRPKLDPDNPAEPAWTTNSARARPRLGSLLPLLGVAVMLTILVGAWLAGVRLSDLRGATASERRQEVTVFPFVSLGEGAERDPLLVTMQEEIVASLSRVRWIRVLVDRPTGSKRTGAFLEGSVRRAGSRVRIAVRLVDLASQRNLWAENFDRDAGDLRDVPELIARGVVQSLSSGTKER